MTEPISAFPQLVYLQNLEARLRRIPADVSEWTEVNRNAKGEMIETVKRPGSAREQLAAEASAAARAVYRRWGVYRDVDAQELMTAVVADVAEAAGDTALAADAREALQEWGVDAKALLSEATGDSPAKATEPPKPLQVEVVSSPPRVHHAIRSKDGTIEGSLEVDKR